MYEVQHLNQILPEYLCEDIINTYRRDFIDDPRQSMGWNAYTLKPQSRRYSELVALFNTALPYKFSVNWINLTIYNEGESLESHKDTRSSNTFICPLNDGFEGGRVLLDNQDYYEVGKGDAILFNGGIVDHGIETVSRGVRYSLNMWTVNSNTITNI